jgi:hypothetical protein
MQSVDKIQTFMLKQVVHIVTIGFKGLNKDQWLYDTETVTHCSYVWIQTKGVQILSQQLLCAELRRPLLRRVFLCLKL